MNEPAIPFALNAKVGQRFTIALAVPAAGSWSLLSSAPASALSAMHQAHVGRVRVVRSNAGGKPPGPTELEAVRPGVVLLTATLSGAGARSSSNAPTKWSLLVDITSR